LIPKHLHNKNKNHVISLGETCAWLAEQGEALGVDIITGFACDDFIFNSKNEVIGVKTKEMGINKKGEKTENFMESM